MTQQTSTAWVTAVIFTIQSFWTFANSCCWIQQSYQDICTGSLLIWLPEVKSCINFQSLGDPWGPSFELLLYLWSNTLLFFLSVLADGEQWFEENKLFWLEHRLLPCTVFFFWLCCGQGVQNDKASYWYLVSKIFKLRGFKLYVSLEFCHYLWTLLWGPKLIFVSVFLANWNFSKLVLHCNSWHVFFFFSRGNNSIVLLQF